MEAEASDRNDNLPDIGNAAPQMMAYYSLFVPQTRLVSYL